MEQLLAWLIRVNLPYSTWEYGGNSVVCLGPEGGPLDGEGTRFTEHPGNDLLVEGYSGFFHTFVFNEHDELIESGSWE
jgi:hypothetical protein